MARSDNSPVTGTTSQSLVAGSGTFDVNLGFPVTSAMVAGQSVLTTGSPNVVVNDEETQILGPASVTFTPSEPVFITQAELLFSRGTYLRQYSIDVQIGGGPINLDSGSETAEQHILQGVGYVFQPGDFIRLSADMAESLNSSSSSLDDWDIVTTSMGLTPNGQKWVVQGYLNGYRYYEAVYSVAPNNLYRMFYDPTVDGGKFVVRTSVSGGPFGVVNAKKSDGFVTVETGSYQNVSIGFIAFTASKTDHLSSSSSSSSLSSLSSSSSSSVISNSSSSSHSSDSSSSSSSVRSNSSSSSSSSVKSNSSSSSSSSIESNSSSSSSSSSGSSSSSESSSSSSEGFPRVTCRIYYMPLTMSTTEAFGGTMSAAVSATSDTGFTVTYENAPVPCVLNLSYVAV